MSELCLLPPFEGCRVRFFHHTVKRIDYVRVRGVAENRRIDMSMSLARFHMSIKLGKILDSDQFVTLVDDTKEPGVDNVEILSREEFNKKQKLRMKKKFEKECVICEKPFWIPKSKRETCSAECFSKLLSLIRSYKNSNS